MGFTPSNPRWQECVDYVNYHLQQCQGDNCQ
jgi:hypothetical protein